MLDHIHLENVLVLDIETVPVVPDYRLLPEAMKKAWNNKLFRNKEEDLPVEEHYFKYAGIYAEFGKIICISAGAFFINKKTNALNFRIKSFAGKEEKQILLDFSDLLNHHYNDRNRHLLCGHNSKEFDFPYLCRRMLVNGLLLPKLLDISGLKPWEVNHLDTMQLWKFGDYKSYTSLELLAVIFGIPSPKQEFDGSAVGRIFWEKDDLAKITEYCQRDVATVAQLLLRFKGMPLLKEEEITFANG